jgi:hypothetical protein
MALKSIFHPSSIADRFSARRQFSRMAGTDIGGKPKKVVPRHGGWAGRLLDRDSSLSESRWSYAEGLRRGGAVVSARVPDADALRLQAIMDRSAVNVRERAAAYRQAGWQSFNAKETPYTADQVRKERELYVRR